MNGRLAGSPHSATSTAVSAQGSCFTFLGAGAIPRARKEEEADVVGRWGSGEVGFPGKPIG